jgi:hypothetical protein
VVLSEPNDLHDMDPEDFRNRVHSFEFWFEAVRGYLSDKPYGHRVDLEEAVLDPSDKDRLVTVLCNYALGETAALEGASGLVAVAPNRATKLFLATQVVDEARHLEVLLHRLTELGVEDPEAEIERRASPHLREFRRELLKLVAGKDWEAAIFAQNVVLESMEFSVFQRHAQTADPITREILVGIIKDERRHIGFGENELGRRLKAAPHNLTRLAEVRRQLDPMVLGSFQDVSGEIGLSTAEAPELGRSYIAAIERLGFAT